MPEVYLHKVTRDPDMSFTALGSPWGPVDPRLHVPVPCHAVPLCRDFLLPLSRLIWLLDGRPVGFRVCGARPVTPQARADHQRAAPSIRGSGPSLESDGAPGAPFALPSDVLPADKAVAPCQCPSLRSFSWPPGYSVSPAGPLGPADQLTCSCTQERQPLSMRPAAVGSSGQPAWGPCRWSFQKDIGLNSTA